MKISLVIPAYNEEKYIGECLKSVELYGKSLFEVIVVDNASTDKTAKVAREFSFARVVNEPRKGIFFAKQRGFRESSGDLLAFIDADCRLSPAWFETISGEFDGSPDLISLSGPYKYYDLPPFKKFLAEAVWWISAPITYRLVGYMILGGNFVVKRNVVEKIGGLHSDGIAFYGEDTDVARRLSPFGKVKFKMDFFVYSSARRLVGEGFIKLYYLYAINFLWEVIFKKPFTNDYKDVR